MIYEYALDPNMLRGWASNNRDYAEFMREYGLGTPRLVSSFPRKKASKLRSYFLSEGPGDIDSLHGQRYLEMVVKIVDSLIIREVHELQSEDWAERTKAENEREPFDVILSSEAIDTPRNITSDNMYGIDSLWNHPRQKNIQRTFEGLNEAVKNIFRLATNQITIVDAYGWTQPAIAAIQSLIELMKVNRVNIKLPNIYLYYKERVDRHNSRNSSPSAGHLKYQILDGLQGDHEDINLYVFELKEVDGEDVFHNRCIFSEHGGVILGHGIGVSGDEAHTDDVSLMEEAIYENKYRQFVGDNRFDIATQSR